MQGETKPRRLSRGTIAMLAANLVLLGLATIPLPAAAQAYAGVTPYYGYYAPWSYYYPPGYSSYYYAPRSYPATSYDQSPAASDYAASDYYVPPVSATAPSVSTTVSARLPAIRYTSRPAYQCCRGAVPRVHLDRNHCRSPDPGLRHRLPRCRRPVARRQLSDR
ncbi:MAG TPA: hypothetical protein VHY35_24015 [Stellaceae bacterium]|jgi:hypothetical protein|nr:hypothetical protein [Stellaceae bacterium]